nr:hypothetical protein [uncultured Ralstonia sp.]
MATVINDACLRHAYRRWAYWDVLRWSAAQGLVLSALFGLCPFTDEQRVRLFDRLQDDSQWSADCAKPARRKKRSGS